MPARSRGLVTILAALGLTLALVGPAAAQSAGSFEIIAVQPTATLSDRNTLVTIAISYRCTFPDSGLSTDPDADSNFGGVVTQVQTKKRTVVSNVGASAALLECDGVTRTMSEFSIESGAGRWAPGEGTLDFFVQFTDVSGAIFHRDFDDIAITLVSGKGNR